jgi:hypothetical protein
MSKKQIQIIMYSAENKEKVIDFLKFHWKNLNKDERIKRFEWRYENNPYENNPVIYIAMDDEKIVGLRPCVVQDFFLKGSRLKVFSGADLIIHPEYRNQKIWTKLTDFYIKNISETFGKCVDLTLSAGKITTFGTIKHGWQFTTSKKMYSYKFSFLNFAKSAIVYHKKNKVPERCYNFNQESYNFILNNILEAKDMAKLNRRVHNKSAIVKDRSEAYFRWKYSYKHELYSYLYCRKGTELKGYIIIKRLSRFKATIEEYTIPDIRAFRIMLNVMFRELGITLLRFMVLSDHQIILSRNCLFFTENNFLLKVVRKERYPVLVRPIKPEPVDEDFIIDGIDIRDTSHWEIYEADIH